MYYKSIGLALFLPAAVLVAGAATPVHQSSPSAPVGVVASAAAPIRYLVAAAGNEVRYRIREKLVGMELPYDAVGTTSAVSGGIAFDERGRLVPAESKLVIDVTGLKSDKERRDGFVQRRLLETEKHPTVEFVPSSLKGLPARLPTAGERSFDMIGNLTIKGVTRPATWKVKARFQPDRVTGQAYTLFTFSEAGIEQPKVPVILSLADTIRLEYDFALQRSR